MKRERYEALKRMAAEGSGASDNERAIALGLIAAAGKLPEFRSDVKSRITIRKGISGSSLVITRKDGKGGCTIFTPIDERSALEFVRQSCRIKLNEAERSMVCERVNS